MLIHYIKVALRNLLKYPAQTTISVLGLAAGFVCLSLSALWMHYENTYDTMHKDYEQIYAFTAADNLKHAGLSYNSNRLMAPSDLARTLRDEYHEVEAVTYCTFLDESTKVNGVEASMMMVDSTFISVFTLPLVQGDYDFLKSNEELAITEELAKRIFPNEEEIVGKDLFFLNDCYAKVGAVIKGYGKHSIFQFDVLSTCDFYIDSEGSMFISIFAKVYEAADMDSLAARVGRFTSFGNPQNIQTIPITDAHKLAGNFLSLSWEHLRVFLACCVLMVVCALINYLVLYLIRLRSREREMALRIVNGSTVGGLMVMFLIEVAIVLFAAMAFGMLGVEWLYRPFARFASITADYGYIMSRALWIMIIIAAVCFVLCILPIAIVRNRTLTGRTQRNDVSRKISSFVQLTVSVILVFCTVVMLRQILFMRNTDWGFNIKGRAQLYINTIGEGGYSGSYEQWMQRRYEISPRLREMPMVNDVLERARDFGSSTFTGENGMMGLSPETLNTITFFYKGIWDIGNPSHGLTVLEGTLPREEEWQSNEVVITETVCRGLGLDLDQAVGHTVYTDAGRGYPYEDNSVNQFTIVAVVKDIYTISPTHKAWDFVFFPRCEIEKEANAYYDSEYITISYLPNEREEFACRVHELMGKDFPEVEYDLVFSEDTFNDKLRSETNLMTILGIITAVCILVAVFGVYSIVTLACAQRRKEIALRKIHGATLADILSIFIKEYGLIVLAASAVAFPIGYIIMKEWVAQYVKQAPIAWWIYAIILLAIVLLIALSVGSRVWRTARENPAEVIKRGG